jgi:hypothetical protein
VLANARSAAAAARRRLVVGSARNVSKTGAWWRTATSVMPRVAWRNEGGGKAAARPWPTKSTSVDLEVDVALGAGGVLDELVAPSVALLAFAGVLLAGVATSARALLVGDRSARRRR